MEARKACLKKILNSNVQIIVPIFQREYSWREEQIKTLWEDTLKLYNRIEETRNIEITHFLGPIVRTGTANSIVDTSKSFIIDGQQRLITLMILLACIRNKLNEINEPLAKKTENMYLLNADEDNESKFKLLPSEVDRENFKKIMLGENDLIESKITNTYNFFSEELATKTDIEIEKLRNILVQNLMFVNIAVNSSENPYLIFESLNAKGTPLTQSDLIRNYIFMKIPEEDKQKELYKKYWSPMEKSLGNKLQYFFWNYSKMDGNFVKWEKTYSNMKGVLEAKNEREVENELKKFFKFSRYSSCIINPENEENEEIKKRLQRHNRWEIGTAHPFLLNIYKGFEENKITVQQFCKILDIIESFVIRRFFCGWKTNKLNTLFIHLYNKIDKLNFISSMEEILIPDWPDNSLFVEGFKTYHIYRSGTNKSRLVLESLEDSFNHKEPVDYDYEKIQIEHIMPQVQGNPESLSELWKKMLGSNYTQIYSKYLHTIGNLTLTGYNPEASKKPFEDKKIIYGHSHFEMNKYFDEVYLWNEEEIERIAQNMANIAIDLWDYPEK